MNLDHQLIWLGVDQSVSLRAYGLSVLSVNVAATDVPVTLNLQTRNSGSDSWADVPVTAITLVEAGSAQVHFNADSLGPLVRLHAELDDSEWDEEVEEKEAEYSLAGAVLATRQR